MVATYRAVADVMGGRGSPPGPLCSVIASPAASGGCLISWVHRSDLRADDGCARFTMAR